MTSQEIAIYREIQKSTEMGMKAIETISDNVYDDELTACLSEQSLNYSEIHDAASKKLIAGKAEYYRSNALTEAMLKSGIHYNTMLNTSTGHIAELMIKGSTNGIIEMEKVLKRNEQAGAKPVALAKQLIELEESNIEKMKQYLK